MGRGRFHVSGASGWPLSQLKEAPVSFIVKQGAVKRLSQTKAAPYRQNAGRMQMKPFQPCRLPKSGPETMHVKHESA